MGTAPLRKSGSLIGFAVQVGDFLAFSVAAAWAYHMRFEESITMAAGSVIQLVIAASFLMLLSSTLVYRSWRGGQLPAMLGRVALAWLITWGCVMTWLVLTKSSEAYSRIWMGYWGVISLMFVWLGRVFIFFVMSWLQGKGVNQRGVLLVGQGKAVAAIRHRVKSSAWSGY